MWDDDDSSPPRGGGGGRGRKGGRGGDREDGGGPPGGGGGGGRGGGGRGGGGKGGRGGGPAPKFVRQIPKFLQAHAHLLESGSFAEDADAEWEAFQKHDKMLKAMQAKQDAEDDESDGEDELMREAKARAVAESESAEAIEAREEDKKRAEEEKVKGNKAFSRKDHPAAIKHFSKCIELDPTNHVFYSNRSACLMALKRHQEALEDAKNTVKLARDWPKGYARLGAALYGLGDYTEAREAYEEGLKHDDDNEQMVAALKQCLVAEQKVIDDKSHKFKKKRKAEGEAGAGAGGGGGAGAGRVAKAKAKLGAAAAAAGAAGAAAAAGVRNTKLLSFDEEGDGEDEF